MDDLAASLQFMPSRPESICDASGNAGKVQSMHRRLI
jgi:hypothetical protein